MKRYFKRVVILLIILSFIISNLYVYAADTSTTADTNLKIEKISNPTSGEGEADGLVPGGDRENSYAWAMAARGEYLYVGTNKNIVGSIADTFVKALTSASDTITEDQAWMLINSMTNNEIPRPTTDKGGDIFKINTTTGEIKSIYTADYGVAFRNAVEFDGNLYFASFCSDTTKDNYIYKVDENDQITVAFTSKSGTSMRASCEYDNSLLFGGVDSREELDAGYEDFQKLGIIKKDANDDTKWDRIADYKDFGDYAKDSAVFSNVTSPIWDMCTYNGYVYASIPNTAGSVLFRGHPAAQGETANEYGWYWEEVIGNKNGVNNLGMADKPEGWTGDEAGLITMALTPITFNGKLYLINFDNTISAEVAAVTGIIGSLAGQDVKASDYLKTMYTTLSHPQMMWCYDDSTGKFNEVTGFSEHMQDNCIEYVWRAEVYNDELYITTMDSAVLYKYIKNLKGNNFTDLTEEEINLLNSKIDEILELLNGVGSSNADLEEIKTLLEQGKTMLSEYLTVANDKEAFFDFVVKNYDLLVKMEEMKDSSMLEMAGDEFIELYNRVDWTGLKMYSFIGQKLQNSTWGFDLLKTSDGVNFDVVTDSGFNDMYNYGGRSLVATDSGLYVGTANPFFGCQLWRITTGNSENPDPENPDPENPDPDNPNPDNPDPDDPNPDDPNPDDPNPDDPNPDNPNPDDPNPDDPNPDNPNPDNPEDDIKDQIKDPDKLEDDLNDINNSYKLDGNDPTTANTTLPKTGGIHLPIIIAISIIIVGISTFKFIKYKNIDKH